MRILARISVFLLVCASLVDRGAQAEQQQLVFLYEDHPPFIYSGGEDVIGIFAEATKAAAQSAGIEILWQETTFNRLRREMASGHAPVCVAGQSKSADEEEQRHFTDSIGSFGRSGLLIRKNSREEFEQIADIRALFTETHLVGGFVRGAIYAVPYQTFLPESHHNHLITTSSHEQLAQLVAKGRIDFVFENEMMVAFHEKLNETGEKLDFVWLAGMPVGREAHIVCTKKVPAAVIARLNQGIAAMKSSRAMKQSAEGAPAK